MQAVIVWRSRGLKKTKEPGVFVEQGNERDDPLQELQDEPWIEACEPQEAL